MDAFELYNEKQKPTGVWCCGKCRKLVLSPAWTPDRGEPKSTREAAESCCRPQLCECGQVIEQTAISSGQCQTCSNAEWLRKRDERYARQMEAAEDVTATYDGPVYCEGRCGDMGDGYFSSLESFFDYHDEDLPEFVFCCTSNVRNLDIERCIENLCDDGYEGMGDGIQPTPELIAAADAFNKLHEKELTVWETDYKRKVSTGVVAKTEEASHE